MCPRYVEATMYVEENIAQIACALARANDSWLWRVWMKFIIEEQLYFGVDLLKSSSLSNSLLYEIRYFLGFLGITPE
jgi:hypothetical protein